jgi:phosphonate transport system permease protein
MAGYFYFDLRELGFLTIIIVAAAVILEMFATRIKAKVR